MDNNANNDNNNDNGQHDDIELTIIIGIGSVLACVD